MNRINDWQGLLNLCNANLASYKMHIEVSEDDGAYSIQIIDQTENTVENFAENFYEDELSMCVNDAWAHARAYAKGKQDEEA